MATIHGGSWKGLKHLRKAPASLPVYWMYCAMTNKDNVAWPSLKMLSDRTGWSVDACQDARKWLVEHKALEPVASYTRPAWRDKPPEELRWRKNLDKAEYYRPTGTMTVDGKTYSMLYYGNTPDDPENGDENPDIRRQPTSTEIDQRPQQIELDSTGLLDSTKDSPVLENAQEAHDDPPTLPVDTPQPEQNTQPAKSPMDYVGCRAAFLAVKWFGEGTVDNAVNMNYGRSKKGEWAEGNLSRPMTAEQIRRFPDWYFMSKAKGGAGMDRRTMSLPTRPGKFKDHAVNYLTWLDGQVQPAPEPELDAPHAYLKRVREERDRAREAAFLSAS